MSLLNVLSIHELFPIRNHTFSRDIKKHDPSIHPIPSLHLSFHLRKRNGEIGNYKENRKPREGGRERREMLAREPSGSNFDLPEEVLEVLPSDPFEQLDVARKITSIALSTRVSALESESSSLRSQLADKDQLIAQLQAQVQSLDVSLSDSADKLARADDEKVRKVPPRLEPLSIHFFFGFKKPVSVCLFFGVLI